MIFFLSSFSLMMDQSELKIEEGEVSDNSIKKESLNTKPKNTQKVQLAEKKIRKILVDPPSHFSLQGILYVNQNKWTVWINNYSISYPRTCLTPQTQIIAVSPHSVTIKDSGKTQTLNFEK
jgi:hypothetical protein